MTAASHHSNPDPDARTFDRPADNPTARAEQDTIAILTAAVGDSDLTAELVHELCTDPARRTFVGLLLAERALTWDLDLLVPTPVIEHAHQPGAQRAHTFLAVVEALRTGDHLQVRELLRGELLHSPIIEAATFLLVVCYQLVHSAPDLDERLQQWALEVAACPEGRPYRSLGVPGQPT